MLNIYALSNMLTTAIMRRDGVEPYVAEGLARKLAYTLVSGTVPNSPPKVGFSKISTLTAVTDVIRPSLLTINVGQTSFSTTVIDKYSLRALSKEIRTYYGYGERAALSIAVSKYVRKYSLTKDTTAVNNRVQSIVNNIMGANAPLKNLAKVLGVPITAYVDTPAGIFYVLI